MKYLLLPFITILAILFIIINIIAHPILFLDNLSDLIEDKLNELISKF